MTDTDDDAMYRAEFDRLGEDQVTRWIANGIVPEPKRQAAFRWLSHQSQLRRAREAQTIQYVRWTFYAAVAAVVVGVVGVLVTLVH